MDRADVIRLATEAGFQPEPDGWLWVFNSDELAQLAALVRAKVLEEAAQVCEQWGAWNNVAQECAGAIRGMADSGHSAAADAGASTAPLPGSLLRAPLKPGERLVCYCPPGVCQAPAGFRGPCNRASEQPEPHAQLMKFYGVTTLAALAGAQHHHIEKLQAKLPASPSLAPQRVREG